MADCSNLIANMCGDRGVAMPEAPCKQLRLEGVSDVTINQGIGIDLADGVHAYDGDGNEIEVVIDPNEINKCDVGVHSVKYTAVGKGDSRRPVICGRNSMGISEDCEDLTLIEAVRTVTIEQIDPPTISGASDTEVASGTNFNPMDGVSAVDGNGNSVDVEFEGEYPASASGKIATFDNESSKPLRSLKVALSPIQEGSGTPSPDNVRPISGHTEVGAYVTGKNLANADALLDLGTGVTYSDEDGYYFPRHYDSSGDHPLFVGGERFGQITLSYKQKQSTSGTVKGFLRIIYTDGTDDRVPVSGYTANTWRNLSVTSNANKTVQMVRYSYNISGGECWMKDIQVELGNSVTAYEPYDAETYTTDLGRTVYGGVLDVVSGKLEVTWKTRVISASEITQADTTRPANQMYLFDMSADDENRVELGRYALVVADRLVRSTSQLPNVGEIADGDIAGDRTKYLAMLATTDLATARQQLDGMVIAYPLAEPEVYQLTPQQVNAFIGTNNVWADDSDNVEVVYTKALPQSGSVKYPDGVYYITYTAEDECGNKTEVTRRIVVGDGNKLCTMRLCEGFADCSQNRTCEAYTCQAYTACE